MTVSLPIAPATPVQPVTIYEYDMVYESTTSPSGWVQVREMELEEGLVEMIVGADGTVTTSYRQYNKTFI